MEFKDQRFKSNSSNVSLENESGDLEKDTCSGATVRIEDIEDDSEKSTFDRLDLTLIIICICSYIFDTSTDIYVAYRHYYDGNEWYCGLTSVFIIIPLLTMTGFSLRWYLLDTELPGAPQVSQLRWTFRIIFLLLQLGPILRYIDVIYYGLKSNNKAKSKRNRETYAWQMIYEDTDAALLRLFESFMEAGPQLILQLYILAKNTTTDDYEMKTVVVQILSIFASLTSVSWALAVYQRALRMSLPDKFNMSWKGTTIHMFWHYFIIASRVLTLALFASYSPLIMSIVCATHWCIMTAWIITMKTNFCDTRCEELAYNAVLGVLFIFCYFNPKDSPTRHRYLFYYVFIFAENTILMTIWFNYTQKTWFHFPAMIIQFLSFVIGIIFMIVYYLLFHPTGNIHWYGTWFIFSYYPKNSQENQVNNTLSIQFIPKEDATNERKDEAMKIDSLKL
ncbi:XK-related protein 4-like [Centruroides sculpturatus]|uniref:XK-related protein 4-like n=1 Tax=Centruroides sculpturatus TaxID=218467 RepID=UPI000C6CC47F|nr:XK-related protein 4-like [Centruroides sculpturatus]